MCTLAVLLVAAAAVAAPAPARAAAAPGAPGALSHFDLARKDCVGTARNRASQGLVHRRRRRAVRRLRADHRQHERRDAAVRRHRRAHVHRPADPRHDLHASAPTAPAWPARSRPPAPRTLPPRHHATSTDPARDTRGHAHPAVGPHAAGCSCTSASTRPSTATAAAARTTAAPTAAWSPPTGVPVVSDTEHRQTKAVNRDYAVPTYMALRADRPFTQASVGYAGTASDGAAPARRRPRAHPYTSAPGRHVVATARHASPRHGPVTLALGFGRTRRTPRRDRGRAARRGRSPPPSAAYLRDAGRATTPRLRQPHRPQRASSRRLLPRRQRAEGQRGQDVPRRDRRRLASPWGQAVSAGNLPGRQGAVYFGSYREVFARDLYEAFTGLLAAGDLATARATARFLFERQQLADGRMPRNSLLNGKPRRTPAATSSTRRRTRS